MNALHLKFGGYQAPASIHNCAAQRFGECLKARLGTALAFSLNGNVLELGRKSSELPDMVARGELDFCYISTVQFSRAIPEFQLLELPFVVKARSAAVAALDGELGGLLARRLRSRTPFRALGFWDNGFRHLSSVRPIHRPEDCRGMTIRTQLSDLHVEFFRTLGFTPLAVDVKEFADDLPSGRFQAQDNPLTNTYNFGVHRYHPYITLTGHCWGAAAFICRQAAYEGWPEEVRAAVDAAAREATAHQHALAAAEDAEMLARFAAVGTEIIRLAPEERAAFVRAVGPLLEKYRKSLGEALFALIG